MEGWDKRGAQLLRYLKPGTPDELQMGTVSGLVDIQSNHVAEHLIRHLPRLSKRNRQLALQGLIRTESRSLALLNAMKAKRVPLTLIDKQRKQLLRHDSKRVQQAARALFKSDGS